MPWIRMVAAFAGLRISGRTRVTGHVARLAGFRELTASKVEFNNPSGVWLGFLMPKF